MKKCDVYQKIEVGFGDFGLVEVFGDGDMASYGYRISLNTGGYGDNGPVREVVYQSDDDYGQVWVALMDGINKFNVDYN